METIQVRALAASKAKGKLEPFEFSLGSLAADQVDIRSAKKPSGLGRIR